MASSPYRNDRRLEGRPQISSFRDSIRIVLCAALLLSAVPATAQESPGEIALLGEDKVVRIVRTAAQPTIDGLLDDPVWRDAPFIDDMHQYRPADHVEPTQKTTVYLLYDDDNLYVAGRMWDSEPDEIRARSLAQGQELRWDDTLMVVVDPFNNNRTGYEFRVNANGVRTNALYETATRANRNWEGIWHAASNIDSEGWTTEIVIPFKTLNFDPQNSDWGFSIQRNIQRNQESIAWVSYNRQVNPGTTGTISGLTGLQQGRGLDVVPTVVASGSREFETDSADSSMEPSLDVFYKFTPSLTGVLTLNTDFSATEVDDRQINLTRFNLFFPEKRDFFLQDVDIFSFGGLRRNGIPFFSRRIGLSRRGQPVDLDMGAKLTGRAGRWNVGFLGVALDDFQDVDSSNVFVGRVAANVLEESSVGLIVTGGDPRSNQDNSLMGADFRYRNTNLPGGRTLDGEAWYQKSNSEGVDGNETAWGIRMSAPNNTGLRGGFGFETFHDDFNPALGFVNRRGIERSEMQVGYTSRPTHRWLRELTHGVNYERFDLIGGGVESESWYLELVELETNSGDQGGIAIEREREVLLEEFDIFDDVIIPPGDYEFDQYSFEISGANDRVLAPSFEFGKGEFFGGDRMEVGVGLQWRPNSRFYMNVEYEHNDIELAGGNFTAQLIAVRTEVAFDVRWSWLNLIQYDNESESVGVNSRLRWTPRAGQDLFVVLNHGFEAIGSFSGLRSLQSQLSVKYTHTFRF
ncbi:MAG: DUF5916 domain-containing protein [Rhodospirillaceae bacterium]|nr:DUF5916 domain-containing protein [Rhodospirillaceae bacterium]